MGDNSAATVQLFNVKGKEEEILCGYVGEFTMNWGSYSNPKEDDIIDGVTLYMDETSMGLCCDGQLDYLEELGVSFTATQDGKYEFPANILMFTPELGEFYSEAFEETPAISASEIEKLVGDESLDAAALRSALVTMTCKAHRDAFKALAEVAARPP